MVHIYIDAEFDAVRINGRHCQMVVSLGAVLKREKHEETFYSLVCPKNFKRLTSVVRKMTHLKDRDIREAESFPVVLKNFMQWLQPYVQDSCKVYSFGPDDRRTLLQECERHHADSTLFREIIDLQKQISATVIFQNALVSATLSLDDLKTAYDIEGAVEHNALTDAHDLMRIHQASLKRNPNPEAVRGIVERKIAKQQEVARKQQEKLFNIMKERFSPYDTLECSITLYPEIVEQFHLWEERDRNFHINLQRKSILLDGKELSREHTKISMLVDINQKIPSVTLKFTQDSLVLEKKYLLQYRNATMVENILKRMLQHGNG